MEGTLGDPVLLLPTVEQPAPLAIMDSAASDLNPAGNSISVSPTVCEGLTQTLMNIPIHIPI